MGSLRSSESNSPSRVVCIPPVSCPIPVSAELTLGGAVLLKGRAPRRATPVVRHDGAQTFQWMHQYPATAQISFALPGFVRFSPRKIEPDPLISRGTVSRGRDERGSIHFHASRRDRFGAPSTRFHWTLVAARAARLTPCSSAA